MDSLSNVNVVELSNHLSYSINEYYRDVNDLDILIDQLNNKKSEILKRMEKDSLYLSLIMNSNQFKSCVNIQYQNCLKEVLDNVKNLIESQKIKE